DQAAEAWVAECAVDGPATMVERTRALSNDVSVAGADGIRVLFAGTLHPTGSSHVRFDQMQESSESRNPARFLLEAYQCFGTGCLGSIAGRFALIIADRSKRRLLAARDAMGLYPLFYAKSPNGLLFSSSIDALLAQPEVPRALDRVVIGEHLVHRFVDPNETYFSKVRRVPPGHCLIVDGTPESLTRYSDPRRPHPLLNEQNLR